MGDKRFVPVSEELWRQVKIAVAIDGMTIKEWFEKLLTETFERRKACNKKSS